MRVSGAALALAAVLPSICRADLTDLMFDDCCVWWDCDEDCVSTTPASAGIGAEETAAATKSPDVATKASGDEKATVPGKATIRGADASTVAPTEPANTMRSMDECPLIDAQYALNFSELEFAPMSCSAAENNELVYFTTDGVHDRCFKTFLPEPVTEDGEAPNGPWPVVVYAHSSSSNALFCSVDKDASGEHWVDLVQELGFVFVCLEAVQYMLPDPYTGIAVPGGEWDIPSVSTDASGLNCEADQSVENTYMQNVFEELGKHPELYNIDNVYVHGCSMGAAFALWQGLCMHDRFPDNFPAFATHSTGLKVKGDHLCFPPDGQHPEYLTGECPECEYWPTVIPKVENMKACIFDNYDDPEATDPYLYHSSLQLSQAWTDAGNTNQQTNFATGGHCVQVSFRAVLECLDDGTGLLLNPSPAPLYDFDFIPAPSPAECSDVSPWPFLSCREMGSNDNCGMVTSESGHCCATCFDCADGCLANVETTTLPAPPYKPDITNPNFLDFLTPPDGTAPPCSDDAPPTTDTGEVNNTATCAEIFDAKGCTDFLPTDGYCCSSCFACITECLMPPPPLPTTALPTTAAN